MRLYSITHSYELSELLRQIFIFLAPSMYTKCLSWYLHNITEGVSFFLVEKLKDALSQLVIRPFIDKRAQYLNGLVSFDRISLFPFKNWHFFIVTSIEGAHVFIYNLWMLFRHQTHEIRYTNYKRHVYFQSPWPPRASMYQLLKNLCAFQLQRID